MPTISAQALRDGLADFPPTQRQEAKRMIQEFIGRKRRLFPNALRQIPECSPMIAEVKS
ncbi:MAG: hypothetical protein JWM32_2884 [Verrucomicrobia bacterium]|nr:hypothetical protein [Verrucomicrobiota bacterium]